MLVPGFPGFYAKYLHQSPCFLCKYTRNVWTHEILEHGWFWNRKKAKERQALILYTTAFRTSAHHHCLTAIPGEKRTSLLQELNKVQVFLLDRMCLTHKTTLQLSVNLRWNTAFPQTIKLAVICTGEWAGILPGSLRIAFPSDHLLAWCMMGKWFYLPSNL